MTYKDNQPTFNVGNRKVVNFKDYLQNKDAEKAKLTKAHLQSKPNSEDQQHPGNKRTEYNPVTHKLTDYSVDEIEDTLDAMEEETNERMKHIKRFNESNTYTYTLLNKNKIVESLVEGDDDVYDIVDNDEIGSSYCKDFKISDLKVGDKIHRVCVSVDDNEYNWCLDTNKIEYYDRMAELSSNFTEYEVVEIDLENNLIKLD